MIGNDRKRHILKTISYRIIQFFVTSFIGWILTGSIHFGLGLGVIETIIKAIVYYFHERVWFKFIRFKKPIIKSKNIHPKQLGESKEERSVQLDQKPIVLWFTGLSGSGKSIIAEETDKILFQNGYKTFILDGDNVRWGINADLGFHKYDREENIRRIAEVAKLFNDSGIIILTAFISPYEKLRQEAKEIIGEDNFIEIYVNTTLKKCMERDSKGLYKKALEGKIKNFTGVNDPYDIPKKPFVEVNGNIDGEENTKIQAQRIFELIENKIKLN